MTEITTEEAAKLLDLSRDRVGQMLRSGELVGRKLGPRFWVADLNSVQDRRRRETPPGRPWSDDTANAVVTALSVDSAVGTRTAHLIANTSTDDLWRKISQLVEIRTYSSRHPERVLPYLARTGGSALERLGERLVGESRMVAGYLRGLTRDELIDEAGLVADSEGRIAIHRATFLPGELTPADDIPTALVAIDCARSGESRVSRIGIRELEKRRERWLLQHT